MLHRDKIILQKVISELTIGIELLGTKSQEEFLKEEILKRALGMTTINVGELVKNLTPEFRKEHFNIPWKAIAGMRDITAHKYQTLRMEDVYNTIHDEFPALKKQLMGVLNEED
ncbi:MAG: HepT-like ribonuclease domain-containing protein [Lachnospiraceae bacterium]|nr:HepT-like ribonuclease domain-containing protein [Lachnospiraceae bacterium]